MMGGGGGGVSDGLSLVDALCPTPVDPPPTKQLRLTRTQYLAALEQLFGPTVVAAVRTSALPDPHVRRFSSELEEVSTAEVEAFDALAFELAFFVADRPAELRALEPCLGTAPVTPSCVQTFFQRFGRAVFRRPMNSADLQRLQQAYDLGATTSAAEGVGTTLLFALTDFEFLYRLEQDGAGTTLLTLTDQELASRLSFTLWNAPPDALLSAAADRGFTPTELEAQVDRLLADRRARATLSRFYDEWLGTTRLPPLAPSFQTADPVRLQAAMVQELRDFTNAVTFDENGSYRDLLTDRRFFTDDAELATLYGVAKPTAGRPTLLPATERAGVLTRAAWLMTAPVKRSNAGHLIKRGVRIGELICRPLPPPNPNLFPPNDPADPATNPNANVRERFHALTSQPQCAGCHDRIDNWGGSFSHYGSAGQFLQSESIFDAQGAVANQVRVDATSRPDLDRTFEPGAVDAVEVSVRLGASASGPQCMAKQLANAFTGRAYTPADGCWVEPASVALQHGSIKSGLKALVLAPQFRLKKL